MTTTELMNTVLEIIQRVMGELFRNYTLTVFGCIFLSLFLSLYLVRKNKKKSYTSPLECTMVFHWILIVLVPLVSGYLVWKFFGYEVWSIALSIVALIISLYGSFLLIRMKWLGAVMADLSLILDTFVYNRWIIGMVKRTFASMSDYNPAGMYSLTGVSYRWIFVAMVTLIALCIMITVIAAYYSRRYYLFFKGDLPVESICPVCGSPVFAGEKFCAMCGHELPSEIKGDPNFLLRGDEKYCTECGHLLRKGKCNYCGHFGFSVKDLQGDLVDELVSKLSGYGWIALAVGLGFIPVIFNPALEISDGSAVIHNAYMDRLKEYIADHSVAQDEEWLADYREKYAAFVEKDNEWINVDFRLLTSSSTLFFTAYSDAAYNQVEVMEEIDAEIHMSARGEEIIEEAFNSQLEFFDQTIEDMGDSFFYQSAKTADWGIIRLFLNYFVDGLQYWSRFINLIFVPVLMLLASIVFYVLLMLDLREDEKITKLLNPLYAFKKIIKWLGELLGGWQEASFKADPKYLKDRYIYIGAVAALVLLFTLAGFTLGNITNDEDVKEKEYLSYCTEVLLQTMQEQQLCVNQLLKKSCTKEDIELIIETFEKEIEKDQQYLEKEDIPENYTEFDSRLDELCQEDIELLNELLEPLRQIKRPEREQLVRLSRLRADKYKDLLYTYEYAMINQAFSALSGD